MAFLISCNSHKSEFCDFEKIIGHWKFSDQDIVFYENWNQVDGKLIGEGFLVEGKDTLFGEKLLVQKIHNHLIYTADVQGQAPVSFKCNSFNGTTWLFENMHHDFPQTILYELSANEKELKVVLEGIENGTKKKEILNFTNFEK